MDYQGLVIVQLGGAYLVARMIASIDTVPVYAPHETWFETLPAAAAFASTVAEQEL